MRSARAALLGHPDWLCDFVAEAIVDEYLQRDPEARLQVRVMGGYGAVFVTGEVSSTADFDVAALVKRVIGLVDPRWDGEPFISLESVVSDQQSRLTAGSSVPVEIVGYATKETEEQLPSTCVLARKILQGLKTYREENPQGFWLGADAELSIVEQNEFAAIALLIEHGVISIQDARRKMMELVQPMAPTYQIRINDAGLNERRGLSRGVGSSGMRGELYGSRIPHLSYLTGVDPRHPRKGGFWLTRQVARTVLAATSAEAILVQAMYFPSEPEPIHLHIRDQGGREIPSEEWRSRLSLSRVLPDWSTPGLSTDAWKKGVVGIATLPWEAV